MHIHSKIIQNQAREKEREREKRELSSVKKKIKKNFPNDCELFPLNYFTSHFFPAEYTFHSLKEEGEEEEKHTHTHTHIRTLLFSPLF